MSLERAVKAKVRIFSNKMCICATNKICECEIK